MKDPDRSSSVLGRRWMGGARGGRRTALEQGVLYTTLGKSDREMATLLGMGMTLSRGVHDTSSDCCSGVSVDSEK